MSRKKDSDGLERADATVEGVGKRFVWIRVPEWEEYRILTVDRGNVPRLRRHPKNGDRVRIGWEASPYREKWGLALSIHWRESAQTPPRYPLTLVEWEVY